MGLLVTIPLFIYYLMYQRPVLNLNIKITCFEWLADSWDENGDWASASYGSFITLDGKIDYDSSIALEVEKVVARITVYDALSLSKLQDEILVQLHSGGTSAFTKRLDFEEQREPPFCADYKYSIAFYSSEGKLILHKGDLENSIKSPLSFPYITPDH